MVNVRVFFKKKDKLKYISHLDLMRAVTRGLLRSELPIVYTEGFNPHPKLVFALPLSIYQESEYEIFDIAVEDGVSLDTVFEKLKAVFLAGFEIFKVATPKEKLKNLALAKYRIELETTLTDSQIEEKLSGSLPVMKKSKSKTEMVDIKPLIKEYKVLGDGVIEVCVVSMPQTILNPSYVVSALGEGVVDSKITRLCLYDADGKVLE
jgi:radical SAM-linked protein